MGSKKKANKEEITKTKQDEQGMGIEYISLPGNKVMIVGFVGIMTAQQLINKFEKEVVDAYEQSVHVKLVDGVRGRHLSINVPEGRSVHYAINAVIDKTELAKIRGLLKKCGENLHAVVMAFRFGSIKTLRA